MTGYSVFVTEVVETRDIKRLDHKDKMRAIAELWFQLTDDDKLYYHTVARLQNKTRQTS